jgi:DNA-directed RNA polymerase sigma subunit (sigma70/sigma32)
MTRRGEVAPANGEPPVVIDRRVAEMRELRATGSTYAAIAERYGITRQRVHQLIGGAS